MQVSINENLNSKNKVDLNEKRLIEQHQGSIGLKATTEVFSVLSPDLLLSSLSLACQGCLNEFSVSHDAYKVHILIFYRY